MRIQRSKASSKTRNLRSAVSTGSGDPRRAGVGYTDDLGVLAAAATAIATHMKPEHTERAKQTMKQWFG